MADALWNAEEEARFAAIREELAKVSTATACQLLIHRGWRNTYMLGLQPLQPLGLGVRLVGRARTCRYLMRRGPEGPHDPVARRVSPEITLIETIRPGDVFCVDALGVPTASIIGDILSARLKANGALAAVIHGAVRDSPYIKEVGLPVFAAGIHPSHSGRDLVPVDVDRPIDMAGVHVLPGDVILADDEGVIAMPLDLAEEIAAHGPPKEHLEGWIRGKIVEGGSVHDYYPPTPEKAAEYERETGRTVDPPAARHGSGSQP
jgi:5-oxopent-3-ene-1,2,5-tricarboxylate decarboxylase/2-hydroxyhepta-2,4-diene-1,7-dioate isomerase